MRTLTSLKFLLAAGAASATALAPLALSAVHAQSEYLVLSQYSGNPGSQVQVMGYGFMPNQTVAVYAETHDPNVSTGMADSNGNFSVSYTVPSVMAGSLSFKATEGSEMATANYYVNGYYPTVQPSSYYIMPGQWLSFNGSNFWPNEPVDLMLNGNWIAKYTANGGSINTGNVYMVPYTSANSTLSFQLKGEWSGMMVPVNVGVGTFYPQVSPSTYYIGMNQSFNLSGSGFAPNEPITVQSAGMSTMATADGSGNFNTNVMAPNYGGNFTVQAMGSWSKMSSQRTVTAY